ncbi:hypothetical protein L6164_035407 [Bauhinia variegata]|uniref:Uncharacterized protein n=1 Tax=Bauhinia variegata TaxID=167791 RepID=A0ACB9KDW7_BAUVA|nr:hypothetical protein L6164_035407 [Bauhinia variegata]
MKAIVTSSFFLLLLSLASCTQKNKIYVVYFGEHSGDKALDEIEKTHYSYLSSVKATEEGAKASLLYSYKHSINGFAALLSKEEVSKLQEMKEVISVFKSQPKGYSLHTTRSWEFVGLREPLNPFRKESKGDLLSKAKYGEDVIVGMIDNGVWPESQSFSDKGMEPVPKRWKGICQAGTNFNSSNCNKKIIGARYYFKGYEYVYGPIDEKEDYKSARDKDGHGTHTASIVAGRAVAGASAVGGFANGTASGGAPLARLAIYKACWPFKGQSKDLGNTCIDIDMLAAIDDAIHDGVDILSISIGYSNPIPYKDDMIARGALHATKNNIVVVCSAGNKGPAPKTLSNVAPWILTVAASTVDRSFHAPIVLDNGGIIDGQSITPVHMENKLHRLVYAGHVEHSGNFEQNSGYCLPDTLNPDKVEGKIVLCIRGQGGRLQKSLEVKRAGGVGAIIGNNKTNGADVPCDAHLFPATGVLYQDSLKLLRYITSKKNPMAHILPGKTVLYTKPAPSMASFSSRGPNIVDPSILKPDITAPGVNILAAWTETDGPTRMSSIDFRVVKYNIFSGTSMSCPHVSAAAALLKAIHPTWSSAAIRSALMTTAGTINNMGKPLTDENGSPATPFAYGSGHFDPQKAADPGLVYDASYNDYLVYTCSIGVTKDLNVSFNCPNSPPEPVNLNYPSIQIHMLNDTKTVQRIVTNVGSSNSVYTFSAKPPQGFSIKASPNVLNFDSVGQKKRFNVTVRARRAQVPTKYDPEQYYFGWFAWSNGIQHVRSPVAVSWG